MNVKTKIITRSLDSAALNTVDKLQKNLVTESSAKGQRCNQDMRDMLVRSERKHTLAEDVLAGNGVEYRHTRNLQLFKLLF
jgi:hypothetical protein